MNILDLRTEYTVNPLGLGVATPRFCWRLATERPGATQSAYHLAVASSPDGLEHPDLWDSGKVAGHATTHIEYAGLPLQSRQRAYWQVTVWDEAGQAVASPLAHFEMGLLRREDWNAAWIGADLAGGPRTTIPAPYLRRDFDLHGKVVAARLYATALGVYHAEINGQKVGDLELAPGYHNYFKRVQYQTYDVTSLLQEGPNTWGAILGDGWYCGHIEWRERQRYGDRPRFWGQLEVEFEDGSRNVVTTGQDWRYQFGPILENDLLQGESHDARLDIPQWSMPGLDTSGWLNAPAFHNPELETIELSAPLGPPMRAFEEIVPIAEPQIRNAAEAIFDFGQNLVGRVRLRVSGPRGTTIRLRFAETLEGGPAATSGPVYLANLRSARQTDYYTLSGEGEEIWEPKFTFHGFRFVEVTGFPGTPTAEALTAIVLTSDTAKTGDFECSDPLINQLQKNTDWGWRGNSLDIPTDCPQRDERMGWTGDAQVFVRTAAYIRDVAGFFTEWQRDIADAQGANGSVPCVVPDPGLLTADANNPEAGASADGGPAWADAVLICPWTIYRCYGDKRILEENYHVFTGYLGYLESTAIDHIRCFDGAPYFLGFGDWLALDGSSKTDGGTPRDLLGTAYYAYSAGLLAQIATVLGKTEDAARYSALSEEIKAVFTRRFVTPEGLLSPPYQTPYILALQFDLVPQELRPKVAAELVRAIGKNQGKLSTGFTSSHYLNHVLTQEGHHDVASDLMFQTQWPSWLYAVTQGATTIWERWDGWTADKGFQDAGMNSFNHYAYGAICAWLYQVVAGIELDAETPGYQKFVLQPRPTTGSTAGLTWVKAHLDTLHGRIESAWTLENGTFTYNYTVPPNTSATVTLPDGTSHEVGPGSYSESVVLG